MREPAGATRIPYSRETRPLQVQVPIIVRPCQLKLNIVWDARGFLTICFLAVAVRRCAQQPSIPGPMSNCPTATKYYTCGPQGASYPHEHAHVEDLADGDEEEEGYAARALRGVHGGSCRGRVGKDHRT